MSRTPIAIGLLLSIAGCGPGIVYQGDQEVPDGTWSREWQPEFTFDLADTVNAHNVFIDLRHTGDYPFSDLYVFATVAGPGLPAVRDTVECLLADANGRWYGKGLGFIKNAHVLYKLNKRFPRAGRYTIRLEQAMRVDPLPAVIDVGISVEKSRAGN